MTFGEHLRVRCIQRRVCARYANLVLRLADVFSSIEYTYTIIYWVWTGGAIDVEFGVEASTTEGRAIVDLGTGRISSQTGWKNTYNVVYPTPGYELGFTADINTQGLLTMKIDVMGGHHRQNGVITNEQGIVMRSTVVTPQQKIFPNIKCPVGQTQIDARLKGNTAVLGI